eukprot:366441-Chlamydomonas_euryale.AAC.1
MQDEQHTATAYLLTSTGSGQTASSPQELKLKGSYTVLVCAAARTRRPLRCQPSKKSPTQYDASTWWCEREARARVLRQRGGAAAAGLATS